MDLLTLASYADIWDKVLCFLEAKDVMSVLLSNSTMLRLCARNVSRRFVLNVNAIIILNGERYREIQSKNCFLHKKKRASGVPKIRYLLGMKTNMDAYLRPCWINADYITQISRKEKGFERSVEICEECNQQFETLKINPSCLQLTFKNDSELIRKMHVSMKDVLKHEKNSMINMLSDLSVWDCSQEIKREIFETYETWPVPIDSVSFHLCFPFLLEKDYNMLLDLCNIFIRRLNIKHLKATHTYDNELFVPETFDNVLNSMTFFGSDQSSTYRVIQKKSIKCYLKFESCSFNFDSENDIELDIIHFVGLLFARSLVTPKKIKCLVLEKVITQRAFVMKNVDFILNIKSVMSNCNAVDSTIILVDPLPSMGHYMAEKIVLSSCFCLLTKKKCDCRRPIQKKVSGTFSAHRLLLHNVELQALSYGQYTPQVIYVMHSLVILNEVIRMLKIYNSKSPVFFSHKEDSNCANTLVGLAHPINVITDKQMLDVFGINQFRTNIKNTLLYKSIPHNS